MRVLLIGMMFLAHSVCAETKTYINEELGVSFEYPSTSVIEDVSQKGKIRIWFRIDKSPLSPGVLFETKSHKGVGEYVSEERNNQIKGGYKSEVTETDYNLTGNVTGVEFVRNATSMGMKMYYFLFPSIKHMQTLSFWYLEDTPNQEALSLYGRMRDTVKVYE